MKPDIRWQVLLAAAGFALVLMLLSYQVQSAALCTASVPASGGTFTEGIVGRPLALNPLLSDPYPVDREIVNLVFDGLVGYDTAGEVVPALAERWAYSEDGLTLTFTLREDARWHDGQPVTAGDVAFTYGLMQDDAFPGPASLKTLWQSVTITPVDSRTIQFTLDQPYTPFIEQTTRGILPEHALRDVGAAGLAASPFNLAPIGTGPFRVEPGQDWARTGRLRLTPNPAAWRQGTQIADLEYRFYPDAEAMLADYAAGELDAVNGLSPTLVPEFTALPGRLFTSVAPRYSAVLFNLGDSGAPALKTREVRQALAYSTDRPALVVNVLNGQGVVFDGPYPPGSWAYRPDLLTLYPPQAETAAALFDGAGWTVGEGGLRQREGQPLTLRLIAPDAAEPRAVTEALVAQWRAAGIDAQPSILAPDAYRQALDEGAFDLALAEIAPPHDPDLYDFWSQEAIVRGQNYAGWNNRRASEALETARQIVARTERAPYYESFVRQYDGDLPALTLYQHVNLYGLSETVQQAEIGRIDAPRDRYTTFADWFLNYRDVTVSCPADDAG